MSKAIIKQLKRGNKRKLKFLNDDDDTDTEDEHVSKRLKGDNSDVISGAISGIADYLFGEREERVYRIENHIYYSGRVDMAHINKLGRMIHEINHEAELLQASIKTAEIVPKPIYLHITSMGGDLCAGFRAIDMMKASKIPVYTVCEGYAISSGSLMFVSGKKRFMAPNSFQLIHQLSGGVHGKFDEMKDDMDNSTLMMDNIVKIYSESCDGKMTKAAIKKAMKHDLLWNYEKCEQLGLVDELYEPNKEAGKR